MHLSAAQVMCFMSNKFTTQLTSKPPQINYADLLYIKCNVIFMVSQYPVAENFYLINFITCSTVNFVCGKSNVSLYCVLYFM
jgi:hypothetical protein